VTPDWLTIPIQDQSTTKAITMAMNESSIRKLRDQLKATQGPGPKRNADLMTFMKRLKGMQAQKRQVVAQADGWRARVSKLMKEVA